MCTKLRYLSQLKDLNIQILGMSATINNPKELSNWLEGEHFHYDFRPVPLNEYYKLGNKIYQSNTNNLFKELSLFKGENCGDILEICLDVISDSCVLVFCSSKKTTENLCRITAKLIEKIHQDEQYKDIFKIESFKEKREELINSLENVIHTNDPLRHSLLYGVAYHHGSQFYFYFYLFIFFFFFF